MTTGAVVAAMTLPANALGFASAVATPNTDLVNGQTVTVTTSGFPASDVGQPMYVFECASQALTTQDESYCDVTPADVNNTATFQAVGSGAGGQVPFKVLAGASFHPTHAGAACGFDPTNSTSDSCYVVVADTATQESSTYVAPAPIKFKDTRAATKTKVKAPKTAKAHKSVKIKITTKPSGSLTGKLVVKDGHKTIKKVKEPANGKVKVKDKKLKPGKHKITAKYSGSNAFQASKGKTVIKVKK